MITKKVVESSWKGVKVSANGPSITHLFFADDILLFFEVNNNSYEAIMDVMGKFCEDSG